MYKMTVGSFSLCYPDLLTIHAHLRPQEGSAFSMEENRIFHKFTPPITNTVFKIYTTTIDKEDIFSMQHFQKQESKTIGRPTYAFHDI